MICNTVIIGRNENIWYAAPMGYGIGTVILCIELLQIGENHVIHKIDNHRK
jgi:hypothetical protein